MPETNVNPRLVKHITLTIGDVMFSKHVNNVLFTPSSSTQTWQGGTPDATFSESTTPTYTCDLTGIQDWETEDSLCNFLLEHEGEVASLEYKPQASGTVTFAADVTIAAPPVGGAVGVYNEFSVSMGSTKPELVRGAGV